MGLFAISDCRFNCHKRCAPKVPRDCLGEVIFNGGKMRNMLSNTERSFEAEQDALVFSSLIFQYLTSFYLSCQFFP